MTETPIFFDQSGRRWRWTKLVLFLFLMLIGFGLYKVVPSVLADVAVPAFDTAHVPGHRLKSHLSPEAAYKLDRPNMPVIGEGPLVRVVQIAGKNSEKSAVEPYTEQVTRQITGSDLEKVQNAHYAIERYGQTYGKRIALTFDDGPDPTYTPQILDVLSGQKAPATFFAVGGNIVKYPEISKRIVREGHVLANHTFNHIDFDFEGRLRSHQEINQTQRVIRGVTNRNPAYFRLPYGGDDDESLRDNMKGLLEAQRLGYTVTSYHIDSNDWGFPQGFKPSMPELDGSDKVILLHDAGGNRAQTITYLSQLISEARSKGYSFVNLDALYPRAEPLSAPITPSIADKASVAATQMVLVWPKSLMYKLFFITLVSMFIGLVINVIFAALHRRFVRYKPRRPGYEPLVSVLVPSYNEERVLDKTVQAVLRSAYTNFEVIIIDDGSTDKTWPVIRRICRANPRVRGLHQVNKGKAAALNHGIKAARGEIIVSLDADTVFMPQTLDNLVRHFGYPKIGAVAGLVKVGNVRNNLARWQGLEYTTGINVERNAQAFMNAILIVPGACAAWRKSTLLEVGGYSTSTLAEDCDLTLAFHRAGYQVIQDNEAVAYTEAPLTLRSLARQRFRWTFGNIQAFWKYRKMILRPRWGLLGMVVLPGAIFSIVIPLLFMPLLMFVLLQNLLAGRYELVLGFYALTTIVQFIGALSGLILASERKRYLLALPLNRVVTGPIRTYLLYRSLLTAVKGAQVGWNKLVRTGTVHVKEQTPTLTSLELASIKSE